MRGGVLHEAEFNQKNFGSSFCSQNQTLLEERLLSVGVRFVLSGELVLELRENEKGSVCLSGMRTFLAASLDESSSARKVWEREPNTNAGGETQNGEILKV